MRLSFFLILTVATSLLAVSILPSVERSAAVFTGDVISVQKVRVVGTNDGGVWALWKAEVNVQTVVTQDVALAEKVFVFFGQDSVRYQFGTNVWNTFQMTGIHWATQVCPPRPKITTNQVYKFFCTRRSVDDDKDLLFVPEAGWAIRE